MLEIHAMNHYRGMKGHSKVIGKSSRVKRMQCICLQEMTTACQLLTPRYHHATPYCQSTLPTHLIMPNSSHPLRETVAAQSSSFSKSLLHPACKKERFRRSFISSAIRLIYNTPLTYNTTVMKYCAVTNQFT